MEDVPGKTIVKEWIINPDLDHDLPLQKSVVILNMSRIFCRKWKTGNSVSMWSHRHEGADGQLT